jgi:hypothetical protein
VAQFYHINFDMEVPYNVYGGMQDNGSWKGPSSVWRSGGIRNSYWKELMFGDGFDVLPDPNDSRYGYAMWQQGNLGYYDSETGSNRMIKPFHPEGEGLRFHWNSAIAQDPFDQNTVYFGSQYIHKTTDKGNNWEIISPDLTRLDTLKQRLSGETGGLTLDVTGAENYNSILVIEPSPIERGVIWTGADDGALHITRDGGANWSDVSPATGVPDSGWIPQIHASRYDGGTAFAVINDYRRGDDRPYLLKTTNYGKSWTNIAPKMKNPTYALSFVQDIENPDLMFLGTERGLYYSLDGGNYWQMWDEGYPAASTMDMKIHPRENDLVVGTFGRAAWIFDDISYMRNWTKNQPKQDTPIKILSREDGYLAKWGTADGARFAGDATYYGDNKGPNPTITFNLYPQPQDTTKPKEDRWPVDSVMVEIYNSSEEKVRTYWVKADTALNRITWDMKRDGVYFPTQEAGEDMTRLPSGHSVLPGIYTAKLTYMDWEDSVNLEVLLDPRIDADPTQIAMLEDSYQEIYSITNDLNSITKALRQKEKSLTVIDKLIEIEDNKEIKDTLVARTKTIRDSLEQVWVLLRGEKGGKGIVRRTDLLSSNLSMPLYYLNSSDLAPGSGIDYMLNHIRRQSEAFTETARRFLLTEWPKYKAFVDGLEVDKWK